MDEPCPNCDAADQWYPSAISFLGNTIVIDADKFGHCLNCDFSAEPPLTPINRA